MLLLNFSTIKAECNTQIIQVTINRCVYNVELEICCSNGPAPAYSSVKSFWKDDESCEQSLDFNQVLTAILNEITRYDVINTYYSAYCQELVVPPCPDQSEALTQFSYLCWYAEKISDEGTNRVIYHACSYDDYCFEEYFFCWNPLPPPLGTYEKHTISYYIVGSRSNCTLEVWEVPNPYDVEFPVGGQTPCFIYHTPCGN